MVYELMVDGKKYPLEMTVEAYLDICELCPEGNFSRLRDINDLPQRERIEISAKMLEALSRGAENSRAVREPNPITATQVLALPLEEFFKIYSGMFEIIGKASGKPTVETAQKKQKEKKQRNQAESGLVPFLRPTFKYG